MSAFIATHVCFLKHTSPSKYSSILSNRALHHRGRKRADRQRHPNATSCHLFGERLVSALDVAAALRCKTQTGGTCHGVLLSTSVLSRFLVGKAELSQSAFREFKHIILSTGSWREFKKHHEEMLFSHECPLPPRPVAPPHPLRFHSLLRVLLLLLLLADWRQQPY
jgi:hypothetical protein